MLLSSQELGARFREFSRSAFRFETLPAYDVASEQDEYQRFLAGEKPPADLHYGWLDLVSGHFEAGRSMQRVRAVTRPLSDYIRYEFEWGFEFNVSAGEDIRILDLTHNDLDLPDQDFWIFDDTTVVHLNYHHDGTVAGREQIEDPDLDKYHHWRDTAVRGAVPFAGYART